MMDDVQSLVTRAQTGDRAAFGLLYERFSPEVCRFMLDRLNSHRDVAEDLTAEVFIKVLQRIGSYRCGGAPFSAWIYRVARNHLIDFVRSRHGQPPTPLDAAAEVAEPAAEAHVHRALDQAELEAALGYLTDDQRSVVTLRYLEGCSLAETARRVGKTEDAVKKIQARGLTQLRHLILGMRRIDTVPRRAPLVSASFRGRAAGEGVA